MNDLRIPLARTFDLYEVWCFIKLLSNLKDRSPYKIDPADMAQIFEKKPGGIVPKLKLNFSTPLKFGEGKYIAFQRSFTPISKGNSDDIVSFSVTMTPDITIEGTTSSDVKLLVILDSKYRVASSLNDALGDLHKYSHAIVSREELSVDSVHNLKKKAFILSPYTIKPGLLDDWKDVDDMPDRLRMSSYKKNFDIGIYSFTPGISDGEVGAIIDELLN